MKDKLDKQGLVSNSFLGHKLGVQACYRDATISICVMRDPMSKGNVCPQCDWFMRSHQRRTRKDLEDVDYKAKVKAHTLSLVARRLPPTKNAD